MPARRTAAKQVKRASRDRPRTSEVVASNGIPTHVVVPIDEYRRLVAAQTAREAVASLSKSPEEFIDAEDFFAEVLADKIARARKAQKLTQNELGKMVGMPQSQVSRLERDPDSTTLRQLKRVARALNVPVAKLV